MRLIRTKLEENPASHLPWTRPTTCGSLGTRLGRVRGRLQVLSRRVAGALAHPGECLCHSSCCFIADFHP